MCAQRSITHGATSQVLYAHSALTWRARHSVFKGEDAIASLTGWHRTRWAEAREEFFWEGVNKESLTLIEKAFCHIHMYDETPSDMQKQAKSLLHADGKSLWFDKSVTFGTYPNGKAGVCARVQDRGEGALVQLCFRVATLLFRAHDARVRAREM